GFVKNVTCPTDIIKHCVPCEKGKEFIDHHNDLEKCRRCKSCDSTLGSEVVKNCTPEENTKCACAKNYFCSSAACDSCNECAESKGEISALDLKNAFFVSGNKKRKGLTTKENTSEVICISEPSYVKMPFPLLDADLSSHIAGMVAEMTLAEVKTFVRHHHVPEPDIDQIIQDYPGDTSEQKIRLFRVWYQRHGMKGAYGTLISSLRELKMCAAADKIEKKLKAAISSSQEGGQSYNGDTEQSKTCTREGRNSYNDGSELSKTYTGSLEET
ncbi:TNR6 factor, partial [Pardalotus punctatus]|nr:TNR6 factor [Pardalotus punctatus]